MEWRWDIHGIPTKYNTSRVTMCWWYRCCFNTLPGQHRSIDHVLQQTSESLPVLEFQRAWNAWKEARPRMHLFKGIHCKSTIMIWHLIGLHLWCRAHFYWKCKYCLVGWECIAGLQWVTDHHSAWALIQKRLLSLVLWEGNVATATTLAARY